MLIEISPHTGTVYIKDSKSEVIVSPCDIPKLIGKLAEAQQIFRDNIKWAWKND